jgi:trigger factor
MSAVITTEIYPEVKLGDYKGLKIKKVNSEIHEAEVEAEISKVVESHARWIDIADREIKVNDKITLDYSGSVDGIQFEGGTAEKATLDIGSGQFIPGFEDQLVGAKIGEERNVEVTFPVDYHSKDLAGKKAVFKCTVHEIKEKQLPELNDDFAKDLGDYDTLEEYKKSVRESLEQKAIDKAKYEEENLLIEKIAINSTTDIPDVLIEQEIQRMINDFSIRMAYSGLKFEDYLKYTGSDMDKFKNEHREEARESVKARLILEAIIKSENLTVEKEEVDKEVELLAKSSGKNLDDFKNEMKEDQIARIMNKIIGDKLFDFLRNNNTFE